MMEQIVFQIGLFLAGVFFTGLRSIVGKAMVYGTWKILRKVLVKTEADLAMYLHSYNQARRSKDQLARGSQRDIEVPTG